LILDEQGYSYFPPGALEVVAEPSSDTNSTNVEPTTRPLFWCAIQVAEGADTGLTSPAAAISKPLAEGGISIFYLSTCEADWILVPEMRIYDAIERLQGIFEIWTEGLEELELMMPKSSRSGRASKEGVVQPQPTVKRHRLAFPPEPICLCSVQEEASHSIAQSVIKEIFFPSDNKRFFSYTETGEEYSLIMDKNCMKTFPEHSITSGSHWRLIKVADGPLGFEEFGIVAALAQPLTSNKISLFYVSTFFTDYALVPEQNLRKAIDCLKSEQERFIVPEE
jgi:hypothetical protein